MPKVKHAAVMTSEAVSGGGARTEVMQGMDMTSVLESGC